MSAALVLATCRELPHLDADEEHLVTALRAIGIEPVIAAWDAGDDVFVHAALTVIRSTWDYTARVHEFVSWVERVEQRARIENKASVVRWNTHKGYLGMLAKEGVAVVPTLHLAAATNAAAPRPALASLLAARGWTGGAVVKPAVSAGSKDTVRVFAEGHAAHARSLEEAQALLDSTPGRDMMVQPFVAGVAEGELSLIYIDGAFSHAVNKVPQGDDFRSQPEFGSHVARVDPTPAQRRAGDDIMGLVGGNLLYGRVDLVRGDDGAPWLMELELVEPSLYLAHDAAAGPRLAAAIRKRLAANAAQPPGQRQ